MSLFLTKWWYLVLIPYSISLQLKLLDKVTMVLNSFDNCYKKQGVIAMHYINHSVVNLGHGKTAVDAVLIVGDNAGPLTLIRSEIFRCKTRQATDCEYFLAITFKDPCKFLSSHDDVWSPFMNSATPHITCEARKGVYVFKNAYLDFTKASQLNVFFQNYWRIRLEIFSNKKLVYCHLLDFEMVTLNRKNRRN